MTVASVVASAARPKAFFHTPCLLGYWPVKMLARAGAHTGWLEIAWRNITPREAIWSRLGVRFMGLRPMAPTQSQRNWSENPKTDLGRLAPGPVWGVAVGATGRRGRNRAQPLTPGL